jgi:hypothetical protein
MMMMMMGNMMMMMTLLADVTLRPCVARQQCALATLILSASQLLSGKKSRTVNEESILNNIQFLEITSGPWLQSRSETYALYLLQPTPLRRRLRHLRQ